MIDIKTMQTAFDRIYSQNGDECYYQFDNLALDPFLSSAYFPGARALDLGCGDGRFSLKLAKQGYAVSAVDISPVGVLKVERLARHYGVDNISCAVDNVLSAQLDLGSYDLLVAVTILNHLSKEEIMLVVERLKRAIEAGSSAYVSVMTQDDPAYLGAQENDMSSYSGASEDAAISETASMMQYYFKKGELLDLFTGYGDIKLYEEGIEEDASHGPLHFHGLARIGICGK